MACFEKWSRVFMGAWRDRDRERGRKKNGFMIWTFLKLIHLITVDVSDQSLSCSCQQQQQQRKKKERMHQLSSGFSRQKMADGAENPAEEPVMALLLNVLASS